MTVYSNAHFGESSGPYHLDGLRCGGYEANLLNCSRTYTTGGVNNLGIGIHNCPPGSEAGVKCDGMCRYVCMLLLSLCGLFVCIQELKYLQVVS